MNAKNLILSLSVAAFGFVGCNNGGVATKTNVALKNEIDTLSYSIGYSVGSQFAQTESQLNIKLDMDALVAGINTAVQKKKGPMDQMKMEMFLRSYFQKKMQEKEAERQAKGAEAKKKGETFLAENAKKEGVKTTESGLQYKIEKQGKGAIPTDESTVKVHYKGTLLDGTKFDSSYDRNEPAQFPVRGVIKGWTEALKLMPVGSKWTLYIPSNLAYGQRGAGELIGPNETLVFEVELLEIVDPKAETPKATK